MKIHIRGGRLIDPRNGVDAMRDVYVAAGKVVSVGPAPDGFQANRVIDATGLVVCPGLVDLSARLREPGYEYKATLESEVDAAAAGGITTLVCPPDTDPPLDEPGLVEMLRHKAKLLNRVHVRPLGALTVKLAGERLTEMAELTEAGCVAFSQANVAVRDSQVLMRAMQYASTFGYTVWLQPQDGCLARGGVAHDGQVASRLGLAAIPVCAETVAIATAIELAGATGAKVHLMRISSAAGLAMIAAARKQGLPVTSDISINHLHLCETDIGYFDPHARLDPPLRAQSDRDALRRGLAEGLVDALCSDHTPVDDDAKQLPFAEAEAGATGVELLLSLLLKWAEEARIPMPVAISRVTSEPARILGLDCGQLGIGAGADLCVFDPRAHYRVTREHLRSQGKNTPFLGLELPGQVRCTLVDGHIVFEARAAAPRR